MSDSTSLDIPPPQDWQGFQRLCYDLWSRLWNDAEAKMHGRGGHPDHGVDIYGRPGRGPEWVGVQCKLRSQLPGAGLSRSLIQAEARRAEEFRPQLSSFIIATTESLDPLLRLDEGNINDPRLGRGTFPVTVVGWEDISRELARHPDLVNKHFPTSSPKIARTISSKWLPIKKISVRDIRCFESIDLTLTDGGAHPALLSLILGDNAAGKSTLLRSIAIGLASESEASALIKELPGSFVRRGADEGTIVLELRDPEDDRKLSITTRISKNSGSDERVRKETDPDPFPWEKIFVCAYGTNRSRQATASHEAYSLHQAVLSLFDDDALLQNPEVVLLRQESPLRGELEKRLLSVLMLDDPDYQVISPRTGIEIQGPWGTHPLRTLSDGYRSTAQWVLDFLAWSLYAGRFGNGHDIGGILLVDELEQHLHPRWQRHFVQRLRQQFPKTQIFASTHTPLVAAGTADVESARLLRLKARADGGLTVVDVDPDSLDGLRADQILASEAFGLPTTRSPGSEKTVDRYVDLLGREGRNADEDAELGRLKADLETKLQTGESQAEREVEQAIDQVLQERLTTADPERLDVEVRRQLHELFAGDEAD